MSTTSSWIVKKRESSGGPSIVEVNGNLKELTERHDYPYHVSVAINLKDESQLPTAEEERDLAVIERRLSERLAPEGAVLAARVTAKGERDLVFYSRERKSVATRVEEIGSHFKDYDLIVTIGHDPEWTIYLQLMDKPQ